MVVILNQFKGVKRMNMMQSCNVFLKAKQYGEVKELSHKLNIPYSELIREGVNLVLKKYNGKKQN
jgi:hypothetical protein